MKRFATISTEEQTRIVAEKNSKNTIKAGRIALNTLVKYCAEKNIELDVQTITANELSELMAKFYFEVRKEDGGYYKLSSFVATRQKFVQLKNS